MFPQSITRIALPAYVAWRTEEMRAEGWRAEHEEELRHLQLWIHRKLDQRAINQQLRQVGKDIGKERL